MKLKWITLVLALLGLCVQAQTKKPKVYFMVSGKITQTSSYCGGAAPSQEMMERYNTPVAYTGKILYVRKGATNDLKQPIVLKIVPDSTGKYTIMLPPGTYCIIQAEQVKALDMKKFPEKQFINLNKQCLKDWWKKPYHLLQIKDKHISKLDFNFHHACFIEGDIPCMDYVGPMPP